MEFVLGVALFWMPLFFGVLVIGFSLIRAVQVTQVCRDAGHMYAYGIDFTLPNYQTLLASMAQGYTLTSTGNAVVILTTVTYISQTDCQNCANVNQIVITRQIVVGNSSIRASSFGTPPAGEMGTSGNVTSAGYLNDPQCQAVNFSSVIPLNDTNKYAYVSEMWVNSPDVKWWSFLGSMAISARSIF